MSAGHVAGDRHKPDILQNPRHILAESATSRRELKRPWTGSQTGPL